MKSAVAIRHVHFEDLGVLEPWFREQGYGIKYIDPATDLAIVDADEPDLLIVLGGPIGACDEATYPFLEGEIKLVRERLSAQRPLLGICLGAQIIARTLGAGVKPMEAKEIGFSLLSLTENGAASPLAALRSTPVLHWHGDQFDIPPGAVRLAFTDVCANQAFAFGPNVLGLQFHLEADPSKIEHWLVGHACELRAAGIDPRAIRHEVVEHGSALAAREPVVIEQWLKCRSEGV